MRSYLALNETTSQPLSVMIGKVMDMAASEETCSVGLHDLCACGGAFGAPRVPLRMDE